MRLNILSDAHWESRVDQVLNELTGLGYRRYFQERDYGEGLLGVVVVMMCQEASLDLKRRIRLSKKDKTLYLDIMLSLDEMRLADPGGRRRIVAERISTEVPEVLGRYSIADFDTPRFVHDLRRWVAETGWASSADRGEGR